MGLDRCLPGRVDVTESGCAADSALAGYMSGNAIASQVYMIVAGDVFGEPEGDDNRGAGLYLGFGH